MKKTFFVLGLCLLGSFLLAGCQGSTETSEPQTSSSHQLVKPGDVSTPPEEGDPSFYVDPVSPAVPSPAEETPEQGDTADTGVTEFGWTQHDQDEINGTTYTNSIEVSSYNGTNPRMVIPDEIEGQPVRRIYYNSFYGAEITGAVVPDSVLYIGENAFSCCKSLKSIDLGEGVQVIGNQAFYDDAALEEITLPDSVTEIGVGTFMGCTGLKTADLGSSLTSIPAAAFANCSALESVTIPESVKTIADNVFEGTNSALVIYGTAGSVAEQYASQNGIAFEAV